MFWKFWRRKAIKPRWQVLDEMQAALNKVVDEASSNHVSPLAIADALEKHAQAIRMNFAIVAPI